MECSMLSNPHNAAFILRLHFHDCFVQGKAAMLPFYSTIQITLHGEKKRPINKHALKGFGVIDSIKNQLESDCPGIVSCADILTIAARDATILVGGPYWDVPLGRKDSLSAGYELTDENLPGANEVLLTIMSKFLYQGLSVTDMFFVFAHARGSYDWHGTVCKFRKRIYASSTTSESAHLSNLRSVWLPIGSDEKEIAMDSATPELFDNSYFHVLLNREGLLNSDQELCTSVFGPQTKLVKKYAVDPFPFFQQFAESMVKLGNITNPETFINGQVGRKCRFVNT